MSECGHPKILSTQDRISEAAWHLRQMENYYHYSDPFRWSLNCYLRSLKEIPQIIRMELQAEDGFSPWFKTRFATLREDALFSFFGKQRDNVVHQKMLIPASSGAIGIRDGQKMRLGLGLPIDPRFDSDDAILNYCLAGDPLGILQEDEDNLPCVERSWSLSAYPEDELLDLCVSAWDKVATLFTDVCGWLSVSRPDLTFHLQPKEKTQAKLYSRDALRSSVAELEANRQCQNGPG